MADPILHLEFDRPVAVVGDIHGCADLLLDLLTQLGPDVPILVIGDVADRGPASRQVIDHLIAKGARGVVGNHDVWLRAWSNREGFDDFALHPIMGGRATLDAYGVQGRTPAAIESEAWRVPPEHHRWLQDLAVAIDLEVCGAEYWLIHAGIPDTTFPPDSDPVPWLAATRPSELIHPVTPPDRVPAVDRPVIMGHVPVPEPIDLGHVVGIDTGAGMPNGRLTAVILPDRTFLTVGA